MNNGYVRRDSPGPHIHFVVNVVTELFFSVGEKDPGV